MEFTSVEIGDFLVRRGEASGHLCGERCECDFLRHGSSVYHGSVVRGVVRARSARLSGLSLLVDCSARRGCENREAGSSLRTQTLYERTLGEEPRRFALSAKGAGGLRSCLM